MKLGFKEQDFHHNSVMLHECIEGLAIDPAGVYVDGTAGGAGHSVEIAKRLTSGRLIAIDKDITAVEIATQRLQGYSGATVIEGDFREIPAILEQQDIARVDGVLLDLGVSSHQLDTPERGFSYRYDAPLDMRMKQDAACSAADIVNGYALPELVRIFRTYGEERFAVPIAKQIVAARQVAPVTTTYELVELIKAGIPAAARRTGGHPAKQVFQAIRIEVNGELDALKQALYGVFDKLAIGGRFVILTFHSLEDRLVKQVFAEFATGCTCPPSFPICVCGKKPAAQKITKKPITAASQELEQNHRSHSAKCRIIQKLQERGD